MECVWCVTQVAHYVWNKTDFDAVDPETTDYLMGELLIQLISLCPLKLYFPAEYYMKAKHPSGLDEQNNNRPAVSLLYSPGSRFHLVKVI